MTEKTQKKTITLNPQEIIITWIVLNREVKQWNPGTPPQAVPRMYNDLSQERIALSIVTKLDEHEDNPEEWMKKFKKWELDFTTEEKTLILKFLKEFPMSLEEIKNKHALIEKLS